jgi:hypothetical protein
MSATPVIVEVAHEWSQVDDRTLLLTSVATYSDGDARTLRMKITPGVDASDEKINKQKSFIEALYVNIFNDGAKAKNTLPVTLLSEWENVSYDKATKTRTVETVKNYSNWVRTSTTVTTTEK